MCRAARQRVARCPRYAHNSLLFVRADSYDAAIAMPLIQRANDLGVETIFLLDDADAELVAAAPVFQDCPFAELDKQVLATIKSWVRD